MHKDFGILICWKHNNSTPATEASPPRHSQRSIPPAKQQPSWTTCNSCMHPVSVKLNPPYESPPNKIISPHGRDSGSKISQNTSNQQWPKSTSITNEKYPFHPINWNTHPPPDHKTKTHAIYVGTLNAASPTGCIQP